MSNTIYTPTRQEFSDRAHMAARTIIYPKVFATQASNIIFEDVKQESSERCRILDGEMAVDRIAKVKVMGLRANLCFTFQERFRGMDKAGYRSLTITEWNHNSNLPSELYKICSGYFLYGYFDDKKDNADFGEAIMVNVPLLLMCIAAYRLNYKVQWNPKNQTYIEVSFDDLDESGLINYHYRGKK